MTLPTDSAGLIPNIASGAAEIVKRAWELPWCYHLWREAHHDQENGNVPVSFLKRAKR